MKKYRYQQLEEDITRLIEEKEYKPHDILPSYAALRETYGHSIATVTRAFDSLEKKGIIYSIHGKGTFVSPPALNRKILILYPGDGLYRDSALFLDGAQKYLFRRNHAYLPVLLPLKFVMENPDNLSFIYPDIKGIIVFRDYASFVKLEDTLAGKNISFLFYGSSFYNPDIRYNSYLYDEKEIAHIMAGYLLERGYRETGAVAYDSNELGMHRYAQFCLAARELGLTINEKYVYRGKAESQNVLNWLTRREWKGMPLYTSHGSSVLALYYLILRAGLSLPDEIGLLGVDKVQLGEMQGREPAYLNLPTSRDGRNCVSYLIDLIEGKTGGIRGTSPVRVVPGGTLR